MTYFSQPFGLTFWHEPGCDQCGRTLYEGDLVAWVDTDRLICERCTNEIVNRTVVGRRSRLREHRGEKNARHSC